MLRSWWILFRSSDLRWCVPPVAVALAVLSTANITSVTSTSMRTSAEAAYGFVAWAAFAAVSGFLSVRRSGVPAADVVALPLCRRSRLLRAASVVLVPMSWTVIGAVGYWIACAATARGIGLPLHHVMLANGLAITTISVATGAVFALWRSPVWLGITSGLVAYVGLAIWFYVPEPIGADLFNVYAPAFLADRLPDRAYLGLQLSWAACVLVIVIAWASGSVRGGRAVAMIVVAAIVFAALLGQCSYTLGRSGRVALQCQDHAGIALCLYADLAGSRAALEDEVDLARFLLPPGALPPVLTQDATVHARWRVGLDRYPEKRTVAADLVVAGVRPPRACPDLTVAGATPIPVVAFVDDLVRARRTTDGTYVDDAAIRSWLARSAPLIRSCRSPREP